MEILSVSVENFRNLKSRKYNLFPKWNWIGGPNGLGKTNFLEAIFLCLQGKSFRKAEREDYFSKHATETPIRIELELKKNQFFYFLSVEVSPKNNGMKFFMDGKEIGSFFELRKKQILGKIPGFYSVCLSPGDHLFIHGASQNRRKWIDSIGSSTSVDYLNSVQKFQKFYQQKKILLEQQKTKTIEYEAVDEVFIRSSAELSTMRDWILDQFSLVFQDALSILLPKYSKIEIIWKNTEKKKNQDWLSYYQNESLQKRRQEFFAQVPLFGPQRQDWLIQIEGHEMKAFASQGEIRACLIALKLAEAQFIRQNSGWSSIFLLDDFSSELDRGKRISLLDLIMSQPLQTIITSTEEALLEIPNVDFS